MAVQPNGSLPSAMTGRQLRDQTRRYSIMARRQAAAGDMTAAQRNLRQAKEYAAKIEGKQGGVARNLGVARNAFQARGGSRAVPGSTPASGGPNRGGSKNPYPTTPVPLTADEIALFDAEERDANSLFQRIRAQVRNDRLRARDDAKRTGMELGWELGTNNRLFGMNAAAQGAGWNPAFMNPGLTGIKREWVRDANANAANLAEREAALDALVQQAREQRRNTISDIDARKAALGASLSGLINGVR